METARHDPVAGIECFFHAVTVVYIDINIQDTGVETEEFEDAQNDVVDVAEARSLTLFGMMETTRPIDSDVCRVGGDFMGGSY